jgi:molybdate transport system substrate-binding protein
MLTSKRILPQLAVVLIVAMTMRAAMVPRNSLAVPSDASPCVLTVAAASDLQEAIQQIAAKFQDHSACGVRISTGSSGNFLTQIENGAPFDLFFSADIAYPKKLEAENLADSGSTYRYGAGQIVLWVRNDSTLDLANGLAALREPAIRQIAIANPQHAPYGRAAEQALRASGVYEAVKGRLVMGENISQAAQFVQSGNAQIGILALSLALGANLQREGHYAVIPQKFYDPIEQGVVVLRASKQPRAAAQFLNYIKSADAIAILGQYGFAPPVSVRP